MYSALGNYTNLPALPVLALPVLDPTPPGLGHRPAAAQGSVGQWLLQPAVLPHRHPPDAGQKERVGPGSGSCQLGLGLGLGPGLNARARGRARVKVRVSVTVRVE